MGFHRFRGKRGGVAFKGQADLQQLFQGDAVEVKCLGQGVFQLIPIVPGRGPPPLLLGDQAHTDQPLHGRPDRDPTHLHLLSQGPFRRQLFSRRDDTPVDQLPELVEYRVTDPFGYYGFQLRYHLSTVRL